MQLRQVIYLTHADQHCLQSFSNLYSWIVAF